jgi:hypothetical protein
LPKRGDAPRKHLSPASSKSLTLWADLTWRNRS